ncbi:hypothetical protein BDB01DRAFT_731995 [Pilobolus umbonatus]|nr:hypothetical protein BDB01DRAFT_731995 [Pilobolus umbonatus]
MSKLKTLTRKYGFSSVLVYLGVGAIDLGITFGVIQYTGSDKIKQVERHVLDYVNEVKTQWGFPNQIQPTQGDSSSLASVFLLAYGIHKTLLLPVRLGVTAAITPSIVKKVHQLGWTKYAPRLFGPKP